LAEACQCLAPARNKLFVAMLNVAMNGEYKDRDNFFDLGNRLLMAKPQNLNIFLPLIKINCPFIN